MSDSWSKFVKDFKEAKMLIIELELERRGKYEPAYVWDSIIERMYVIEMSNNSDVDKISLLLTDVCRQLLIPTDVFPRTWMIKRLPELRDKLNYYRNNPEEEE